MKLRDNRTVVRGVVEKLEPAEGWGANVSVRVESAAAASGYDDFLNAAAGTTVEMFAPEPDAVSLGDTVKLTVTVVGGPDGERTVVQHAERAKR